MIKKIWYKFLGPVNLLLFPRWIFWLEVIGSIPVASSISGGCLDQSFLAFTVHQLSPLTIYQICLNADQSIAQIMVTMTNPTSEIELEDKELMEQLAKVQNIHNQVCYAVLAGRSSANKLDP